MIGDTYDKESIKRLAAQMKFASAEIMEKFIMDFHIHKILSMKMNVVLRGGMCASLYTGKDRAMRLSKDIDLFTREPREAVEKAIQQMVAESEYKAKPRRNRDDVDNLLQYDIRYETKLGTNNEKDSIQLDIIFGTEIKLPHKTIPKGLSVFTEETGYDIVALTRGVLLADKITSLAHGSIGYKNTKNGATSKQIFDISMLLDGASDEDIADTLTTYRTIAQFKIEHYTKSATYEKVLEQIEQFLEKQLIFDRTIKPSDERIEDTKMFKDKYLPDGQIYDDTEIKSRVLKTLLLAVCIKAVDEKRVSTEYAVSAIGKCIVASRENPEVRREVLKEIPENISRELLQQESLQNLLLLGEILKICDWNPQMA